MNRKEPERTKRSKSFAINTYVGNNRQMLQDIRESLSHVRNSNPQAVETPKVEQQQPPMQIKGSEKGGTNNNPDPRAAGSQFKSNAYRQKALAEIRDSLLPFANVLSSSASPVSTFSSSTTSGVSSASGLSTASGSSSPCPIGQQHNGFDGSTQSQRQLLQNLQQMGFPEERVLRAIGMPPGRPLDIESHQRLIHDGANFNLPKVVRRQSFEHDFAMLRGSPATMDGSTTGSTRSDSPSCTSLQQHRSAFPDPPRLISSQGDVGGGNHLPMGRQYSPSFGMEPPPPPPPPPPRPSGPSTTPTRGTTPPPQPTSQSPFASSPQVPHMLKRISPVPPNSRPPVLGYGGGSGPISQSSTPQRGTSPSALGGGRMMVHNSQQLQQQINQQLQQQINQQLQTLYNGGGSSNVSTTSSGGIIGSGEPPPPYPLGVGKMVSPIPYVVTPQSRQSPSQSPVLDLGPSPGPQQQIKRPAPPPSFQVASMGLASSVSVGSVTTSRPVALQAWSTRQQPIIMQSVKSTQVQKPVLQTAVAPSAPPPSYVASIQQQEQHGGSSAGDASPVPTTDPPSYASSIQALVASASSSTSTTNVCHSSLTSYNLMHHHNLPAGSPSSVEPLPPRPKACPTPPASDGASSCASEPQLPRRAPPIHPAMQRKFSSPSAGLDSCQSVPPPPQCPSSESSLSAGRPRLRPPSPTSGPPSEHSSTSSAPPVPPPHGQQQEAPARPPPHHGQQQQTEAPQPPGRPPAPSPQQQPHKTTLHSPIPERKSRSRDDEALETKVKNYSPQAYKFFMEQHMENVFKSQQQRVHRRVQLEAEMAKVGLSEEAQCQMRRMLHQKESNYIRLKRAKMDKAMFVKIKTIGVGAFGEVALVRKIDTQQLYAMKTLRKVDVLQRNQVAHVKAERDILAEADNEWVVKLYYSFQDKDNLYFVMDYIPGGDLMSLLIKFGIFHESLAGFYIAELLCAIESVHKMGFIHRDIKPDNILIDRYGHIKLTDFGLCTGFRWTHNSKYYQKNGEHSRQDSMDPDENWMKECRCNDYLGNSLNVPLKTLERRRLRREHQRCLAHSLVGTPNYIAPEVLMRTGYTQLCDWWSVGVILFEMLVGQPPFLANTPAETQYKVIHWETSLRIPKKANLSAEAKDLILKLCAGHEKRLGKNGANEIKQHPYFERVDFDGGLRRQAAPYLPTIMFNTDTSNFDPVDPDKLRNSDGSEDSRSELCMEDGKHPEHAFYEFTFRRFFDDGGHAYPTRTSSEENDGQNPVYV